MVTPRTDLKHDGICDSPVAPQEKATDPCGQHKRKTDTAFPAREESRLAWLHTRQGPDSPVDAPAEPRDTSRPWRGTQRFRPQLQMRTSAPGATAEESRVAPSDSHGDCTSLRPHERVPEVPIITREVSHCNSRKTRRFSPKHQLRTFSGAVSPEKSHLPS